MILGIYFCVLAILIDQLTKFMIYGNATISILGNILWFESTLNTGVAFSLFENGGIFLIIISALASIFFLYLIFSKKYFTSKFEKICIGLVLGGTFSNLIDRIIFGGVRDFIYLKFINFAIFNVADMCIVLPIIAFVIYNIVILSKKGKQEKMINENHLSETQTIKTNEEQTKTDDGIN